VKRPGYTLFEMVIVVALIVLLAGLAVPSIEAVYADYKLQSAVDEVRGRWAAMRARAVTEGQPYRFACISGTGEFRVAPDGGGYWGGGDAAPAADSGAQPLVVQDSLPPGITFAVNDASADVGGGWTTAAVFLPDGTALEDQEIVFRYADAEPIALRLRALTGGMSTQRVPANGQR
jgi:prepilin-type N-terminal cleavage/methylation domain-containing protein